MPELAAVRRHGARARDVRAAGRERPAHQVTPPQGAGRADLRSLHFNLENMTSQINKQLVFLFVALRVPDQTLFRKTLNRIR